MPAIASLGDLKSAQKDLLEAKDLDELKAVFKKWRRIGWKNICKLWLEERSPDQLKGEGNRVSHMQKQFKEMNDVPKSKFAEPARLRRRLEKT